MPLCGNATAWAKVALALVIVGFALHCAGFATKYWEQNETVIETTVISYGLWKGENCSGGHNAPCNTIDIPESYLDGAYNTVRAFEILVMITLFITAVVFVCYIVTDKFRELSVGVFITIMCFITVTIGILGMIVWLAQLPTNFYPGYSFGLCVFTLLLVFLAGILMIPEIRQFNKNKLKLSEPTRVIPADRNKYDSIGRQEYRSYNRKFAGSEPETPVRHYHNPNREQNIRSLPPSYGGMSVGSSKKPQRQKYPRSEVQTPDVYLGRDSKYVRRY